MIRPISVAQVNGREAEVRAQYKEEVKLTQRSLSVYRLAYQILIANFQNEFLFSSQSMLSTHTRSIFVSQWPFNRIKHMFQVSWW